MTTSTNEFVLTIPGDPKYLSVVRLAVSGLAGRLQFSYEEVEDIKLAVAEACARAISQSQGKQISIECKVQDDALTFSVSDNGSETPDEEELGIFLIRSLMDEVKFENLNGRGSRITMKKRFGEAAI